MYSMYVRTLKSANCEWFVQMEACHPPRPLCDDVIGWLRSCDSHVIPAAILRSMSKLRWRMFCFQRHAVLPPDQP